MWAVQVPLTRGWALLDGLQAVAAGASGCSLGLDHGRGEHHRGGVGRGGAALTATLREGGREGGREGEGGEVERHLSGSASRRRHSPESASPTHTYR